MYHELDFTMYDALKPLCVPKTSSGLITYQYRIPSTTMVALLCFFLTLLASQVEEPA